MSGIRILIGCFLVVGIALFAGSFFIPAVRPSKRRRTPSIPMMASALAIIAISIATWLNVAGRP